VSGRQNNRRWRNRVVFPIKEQLQLFAVQCLLLRVRVDPHTRTIAVDDGVLCSRDIEVNGRRIVHL